MENGELMDKMTRWEALRREADELETQIKAAVMQIGHTQAWGKVKAEYSNGRGTYDWEAVARQSNIPEATVEMFTFPRIDWRALCQYEQLDPAAHYTPGTPTVYVKLMD